MRVLIVSFITVFLIGCVQTNYSKCYSDSDNFPETFKCIKQTQILGYAESVQNHSSLTNIWKCGDVLSAMTIKGELTDKQAWYLFNWASQGYSPNKKSEYKCVDWERLKKVENAQKEEIRRKQNTFNN